MRPRLWLSFALLFTGCGHSAAKGVTSGAAVLLVHDDGKTEGSLTFPTTHHESVVRFELPPGEHQLRRLWVQATAAGSLHWALYEQTPMEAPGAIINEGTLVVTPKTVSNGK